MTATRPEFVDNQGENTLDRAIHAHLAWLWTHRIPPITLDVATGFFNIGGYSLLAGELEKLDHVRLLLGAEVAPPAPRTHRAPGEPRGHRYQRAQVDRALKTHEDGMRSELNLLGFTEENDRTVDRLVAFLRSGKAEVRRYTKAFMHGKAFVFGGEEGVLAGSSNLTWAGLKTNIELNLGQYQPHVVKQVHEWFERLWEDAEPYDLAALFASRFREYPPYWIYLRALYERYGEELKQEQTNDGRIPLTTFQNDGLLRARRILERFNGVLIADGVGLGKSYLAGEMIREAVEERRQRVLLVAPATLRDGSWATFQSRQNFYFEVVSYEQLARDQRLRLDGQGEFVLKADPNAYAMVVVDEAHALRNPDADRSGALRRLLRGSPPKKLVLLSATPVNNTLWDLYYLLGYFIGHDAAFADEGIPSLKKKFQQAMRENPYELKPDVLFDVLDAVTVRRTRNFVRKSYPHEKVRLGNGQEIEIKFPRPRVRRIDYDFDAVAPGFFAQIADALMPPDETHPPKLTMARYVPSAYLKSGIASTSQEALAGLLRSAILKRFESSVFAFATTTERMVASHDRFLELLQRGLVPTRELMTELADDDAQDLDIDALIEELGPEAVQPASGYRVSDLRRDVQADRDLLAGFATRARTVDRKHDPKLAGLGEALLAILKSAEAEAISDDNERDLRKVLVFTYYADTVEWIVGHLETLFQKDKRFAKVRGRVAAIAGDSREGFAGKEAVLSFTPRSTDAPRGTKDLYDVVVCTDVLAEGLNLQQCRNLINYDLPWNPMRLVQRHGRIDRIGSTYDEVFISCFFPTQKLDDMLALEKRLRMKLAQAAATVGVEDAPIPEGSTGEVVFTDSEEEIRRLHEENAELLVNAGESEGARSGEEYRQELRRGLDAHASEIKSLPYGAGSGLVRGRVRGHFFCVRVLDRVFYRFVPIDGAELVRDTLRCLRVITCVPETPRHLPDDLREGAYAAWSRARKDVFDEWMRATDPANLQPRIRPLFLEIGEHLRRYPPPELTQPALEDVIESVVGPWPIRFERELRAVFVAGEKEERSTRIVEKVRELALQPYHPPKPLDEIDEDEVQLVCWMGVEASPASIPPPPRGPVRVTA